MEIKEWRSLALQSICLLLVVAICCICFERRVQTKQETFAKAQEQAKKEISCVDTKSQEKVVEIAKYATKSEIEARSDSYIRIPKTEVASASAVYISNDYMDSAVEFTAEGVLTEEFSEDSILRIKGYEVNKGKVSKKEALLKKLSISKKKTDSKKSTIQVRLCTKKLYEPVLYEAEDAYYVSLLSAREAFDHIVVIDAGHGGMDEGTTSLDGKCLEKDIALLVTRKLKKLLEEQNIKVYITRTGDYQVAKSVRTKLPNSLRADLFISIHCNASSVGDSTAYGLEALYSNRKTKQSSMTNKKLAQIILDQLSQQTGQKKRGTIRREGLYLLHHAKVPTSIIEIGYMSNKNDLKYLRKEKSQQNIAQGICNGICSALEEEE